MAEQEQDRSEAPTPFKLRRAREKGQVARGMDLGFVGSLLAFAAFLVVAGPGFAGRLTDLMRLSFTVGIDRTGEPGAALGTLAAIYWLAFQPLLVLGGIIAVVLIFLELVQLRGFIFTTAPLKPDFTRLNPAKGLKRIFSLRMVKETLKNVIKMAVYAAAAWWLITGAVGRFGDAMPDAVSLAKAMDGAGQRLLFTFIGIAFVFMVIDQVIVRGEFMKQMRMSRRELTRENREREGNPGSSRSGANCTARCASRPKGSASSADRMFSSPIRSILPLLSITIPKPWLRPSSARRGATISPSF